jgi:predicted nuclease of predicted toxin-antitoxin system
VKLLFDHNLSPKFVQLLADISPHSNHLFLIGLDQAPDRDMREYALREGFIVVTKDSDYSELCQWLGFPPKVIWIRRGNCRTSDIEQLLRDRLADIEDLNASLTIGTLTLF